MTRYLLAAVILAFTAASSFAQPAGGVQSTRTIDGNNVTLGAKADSVCGTATGTCSLQALIKYLNTAVNSAMPAQANTTSVVNIGNVGQTNGDPCSTQAHVYTPINKASAATTVLVAGVSSKKKYVCHIALKNALANNVAIVEGSGSTCGTSTLGLLGGTTSGAGYNFAANDGIVQGTGTNAVAATTVNANDLCIILSASSQVSGVIVTADQ